MDTTFHLSPFAKGTRQLVFTYLSQWEEKIQRATSPHRFEPVPPGLPFSMPFISSLWRPSRSFRLSSSTNGLGHSTRQNLCVLGRLQLLPMLQTVIHFLILLFKFPLTNSIITFRKHFGSKCSPLNLSTSISSLTRCCFFVAHGAFIISEWFDGKNEHRRWFGMWDKQHHCVLQARVYQHGHVEWTVVRILDVVGQHHWRELGDFNDVFLL